MNRTKGILAAGTFTALILITILALGFGNFNGTPSADAAAPAAESFLPQTEEMTNEEAVQSWQDYSAQLEETVRVLQERDAAYQQQLNDANQTILQLQDQINNDPSPSYTSGYEEHDEYEEEEYEHEEHEREDHEWFEFGEDDD